MKTIRFFALAVALVGLVTSTFSSASTPAIPSHLAPFAGSASSLRLPMPTCGPGVPTCVVNGAF